MRAEMESLQMQALGRTVEVGHVYDIRENKFCRTNVFNKYSNKNDYQNIFNQPKTKEPIFVDFYSHSESFSVLKLTIDEQIALLSGSPGASHEYLTFLTEKNDSSKSVKKCLMFRYEAATVEMKSSSELNWDVLNQNPNGTHVVGAVQMGANTFVTLECKNVREDQKYSVENMLTQKLKELEKAIKENLNFPIFSDNEVVNRFSIHVYGDVIAARKHRLESLNEVYDVVMSTRNIVPLGLYKPLTFYLFDIKELAKKYNVDPPKVKDFCVWNDPLDYDLQKLYVELLQTNQSLKRVVKLLNKPESSISKKKSKVNIIAYKLKFDRAVETFQNSLKKARNSSKSTSKHLTRIVKAFDESEFSPSSVRKFLEKDKRIKENVTKTKSTEISKVTKCIAICMRKDLKSPTLKTDSSPIFIPCPGSFAGCCKLESYDWTCSECEKPLGFQTDCNAYCECGGFPITCYGFACTDEKHGDYYLTLTPEQVESLCKPKIQANKVINIVLMGETGVGKSTFINAFANYLTFETLEEAEKSDAIALIHSSFTVADENFDERIISFGKPDENENDEHAGSSRTQSCKSYVFPLKENTIRIIDTPGIGDTRGREQDQKNLDGITKYIATYEDIHCICFLMKPNTARLNVAFRSHFVELFSRLHKTASPNIVFVFTNARSTFYRPGDTFPPLKEMLKELCQKDDVVKIELTKDYYYCMDNESFRFLVLQKHEEIFDEDDKRNFAKSWKKSADESQRLIEHVTKIPPHSIKYSKMVSVVKKTMLFLSQSMAQATVKLQNEILEVERKLYLTEISESQSSKTSLTNQDNQNALSSLEAEQNNIIYVRAQLNMFLELNAISSHYDQTAEDLKKLCADELIKSAYDEDKKMLIEKLEKVQEKYEQERSKLSSTDIRETEDLEKLVKTLYALEFVGKDIKSDSESKFGILMGAAQNTIDVEYIPVALNLKIEDNDSTASIQSKLVPDHPKKVNIHIPALFTKFQQKELFKPIENGPKKMKIAHNYFNESSKAYMDTSVEESGSDCSFNFKMENVAETVPPVETVPVVPYISQQPKPRFPSPLLKSIRQSKKRQPSPPRADSSRKSPKNAGFQQPILSKSENYPLSVQQPEVIQVQPVISQIDPLQTVLRKTEPVQPGLGRIRPVISQPYILLEPPQADQKGPIIPKLDPVPSGTNSSQAKSRKSRSSQPSTSQPGPRKWIANKGQPSTQESSNCQAISQQEETYYNEDEDVPKGCFSWLLKLFRRKPKGYNVKLLKTTRNQE